MTSRKCLTLLLRICEWHTNVCHFWLWVLWLSSYFLAYLRFYPLILGIEWTHKKNSRETHFPKDAREDRVTVILCQWSNDTVDLGLFEGSIKRPHSSIRGLSACSVCLSSERNRHRTVDLYQLWDQHSVKRKYVLRDWTFCWTSQSNNGYLDPLGNDDVHH